MIINHCAYLEKFDVNFVNLDGLHLFYNLLIYTEYYLGSDLGILWMDWPFQAYLFIIFIPSYPIDLFLHWVEEKRRYMSVWKKKKKKKEKKKKIVWSSIYSNVLGCLVTRGIHCQCLLLHQTITWNMSMQKHFKFVTYRVTGCIHHKCLHLRQKISDDLK